MNATSPAWLSLGRRTMHRLSWLALVALVFGESGCGSSSASEDPSDAIGGDEGTQPASDPFDSGTETASSSEAGAEASTETGPGGADDLPVGCVMHATSDVNLREGPSTTSAVIHVIPNGDAVTVVTAAPTAGWYNVKHGGATGWASGTYFDKTCATASGATIATIEGIVSGSSCASYSWADRGEAPPGYVKGVALVFARAVCNPTRSDVVAVSQPKTTDDAHDALSWYASRFSALGMSNDAAGVATLRHVYTLLLGLGMRESSGQHCCGRDTSATNTSSDSAEAGAWQTSYDSHTASPELPKLFTKYRASATGCYLDVFKQGVTCSAADWKNWGTGDGLEFQSLEKNCPAFAAEYAAVMLRVDGGQLGHYGPLRTHAAEVRPECDEMFQKVQSTVEANPALCASL